MSKYKLGIDIGSTTIKLALIDTCGNVIYSSYRRHLSDIRGELLTSFEDIAERHGEIRASVSVTGSAGLSVAKWLDFPFVQEVVAGTEAVSATYPETDCVIELGGEDAKITFFKPVVSQRMNGTCAGGTGAFIDQMASLLQTDASGLNELAKKYETLYPIASRCGVFAKSDIQPLLNEGAGHEDLAASIFQAVVNQTIGGLACGQPIKGNIVFLGGPLHFLSELRRCFENTLAGEAETFTTPENAEIFVAMGAGMLAEGEAVPLSDLPTRLTESRSGEQDIPRIRPLFADAGERADFYERHSTRKATRGEISSHDGPVYLGIDAGSTTIKAVLLGEEGEILYTYYDSNNGTPLDSAVLILRDIYSKLPESAHIAGSCVTGYGEALIKTALKADLGEIETLSHYTASKHFAPDVDYIIDIGGQDMKCMKIKNGIIDNVILNEACSSGCGSFIQTFAKSLGMTPAELGEQALLALDPVDLGTRCTVFMNSRVKQAQKEGATPGDISAGLAYSVVRNALYKVIKFKSPEDLGRKVLVQGGTFYNDAILRAFEVISGREVIRPDIAGLMGAFGAGLIARNRCGVGKSSLISLRELDEEFVMTSESRVCGGCANNCKLTISRFDGGRSLVTGNRCERGDMNSAGENGLPNLIEYKYRRLFSYRPLPWDEADRGEIGIPRVLNIYENYPFWHTMLTELGFRVRISARSSHEIFEKGMSTIPSESVCYPAKLAHGHIVDLAEKGVKVIFYPCLPYEVRENETANDCYNCPIVTSYPEVIKNNMEILGEKGITFMNPFLSFGNKKALVGRIAEEFSQFGVTKKEAQRAVEAAYAEQERFKADIQREGEKTIRFLKENGGRGIVLAGRPYHADPEIHHGIPQMINSLGMAVLTEDSISHLGRASAPLSVSNQWVYHTRLYDAAEVAARYPFLEVVQLNSFGCGLDAVTTDQVQEILEAKGRIFTLIKIDEISNLGAARIRMRSLKAALEEMDETGMARSPIAGEYTLKRALYTEEMRNNPNHTLLVPQMAPFLFRILEPVMKSEGYNIKVLEKVTPEDIETGLRYVNNDACYPSIVVVGQITNALLSGEYDLDNTSVLMTQTGGGCRATNYVRFLRKAFKDAGFPQVPVVSLSVQGLEKNPGLKYTPRLIDMAIKAMVLGDLFQNVVLRVRPYEIGKGDADRLYDYWHGECVRYFEGDSEFGFAELVDAIVDSFDSMDLRGIPRKPRVGIVGEILVKYHPEANNHAIEVIEEEGCEAVVPGLIDFLMYSAHTTRYKRDKLGMSKTAPLIATIVIEAIEQYRKPLKKALAASKRFDPPLRIEELAEKAEPVIQLGSCCGEGWLLTAEMVELIESGTPNIICVQPFACLPNHVTGKGMLKEIRRRYPESCIVPIDYDPGASEVNQLNRIKLMISTAKKQNIRSYDGEDHGGEGGGLAESLVALAAKTVKGGEKKTVAALNYKG